MDKVKTNLDFSSVDNNDPQVQVNTNLFVEFVQKLAMGEPINPAFDHEPPKDLHVAMTRIQDTLNAKKRYAAPPVAQSFDATSGPVIKEEEYPIGLR